MAVVSAGKTHIGLVADHNEDYVWLNAEKGIFIVADGMGGHEAGEVASRLAATTAGEKISAGLDGLSVDRADEIQALIIDALEAANQAVWEASGEADQIRRMGATIAVAVVRPPQAYISHAGDARVYLHHKNQLSRLTEDDSWVAHLVATGVISEAEVRNNRLSHVITKAVGQGTPIDASFARVAVKSPDWLLLCSDGLWNMVDDEAIQVVLQSPQTTPTQAVETLVEAANEAGGKDNISIVALQLIEEI